MIDSKAGWKMAVALAEGIGGVIFRFSPTASDAFEEIDAGLQKTEGMILSHKEPEGLKDILPIPKPLVYMQILPDHFTAIRYDWMKQGGGNPYDMEHIDQQLPDLRGILAFRPPGPILVCVSEVKIKQFKKLIKGKLGNQAFIFQNDLIGSRFYRLGDGAAG